MSISERDPTQHDSLDDFDHRELTFLGRTKRVFVAGTGPAAGAIVARTVRAGSGRPTPAAWLRRRLSCNASRASGAILTSAKEPKPVLMP